MTGQELPAGKNEAALRAIRDGLVDELTDSEARFRALATHLTEPLIMFNEQGVIDFSNPAAENLFGYGPQELIGRNLKSFLPPITAGDRANTLLDDLPSRESRAFRGPRRILGRRADGQEFPVEVSLSDFVVKGRRWFVGLFREVIEPRSPEEQFRGIEQDLPEEPDRQSEFVRLINHHLRTPLTPILGYAELLLDEKLTEHQRDLVAGIQRNAQQLLQEVSSLLDANGPFEASGMP